MRRGPAAVLVAAVTVAATAAPAALAALPTLAARGAGPVAEITMPGKYFSPADLSVLVGTTVTWRNTDAVSHTATADDGSFDSGPIAPAATFTQTFATPGTHALHCTIHRFMRAIVHVYALVLVGPQGVLAPGGRAVLTGVAPTASGGTVTLDERRGDAAWTAVARTGPAADGSFSFARRVDGPTLYRARAGATTSPVLRVLVAPAVQASRRGRTVTVTTSPPRPSARLLLQFYVRERFAFATRSRGTLDSHGRATIALPAWAAAGDHVRIVVTGRDGWSDGRSNVLLVPRH